MGHTNYWTFKRPVNEEDLNLIKLIMTDTMNEVDTHLISSVGDNYVSVNGQPPNNCENFFIGVGDHRSFCKTRYFPYDDYVVKVLEKLKDHGLLTYSSDS